MSLTTDVVVPLTTVWTPPTPCLATATYNQHAIWAPGYTSVLSPAVLLGATGQAADLVCYPPRYTLNHIYSPGICPSGWTSACEPIISGSAPASSGPATTVQCCPSSLTCSGIAWCRGDPAPTDRPIFSIWTDKYGMEGVMTTTNFPGLSVLAKPIFVAYESSDESVLAAARSAATQSSQSGSISHNSTSSSSSSSGGSSLSGGAIAGIAIGSLLGGVILATVITFLALRFCMGYRKMPKEGSSQWAHHADEKRRDPLENTQELGSQAQLNELHSWPRATELPVQGVDRHSKAELENQQ